MATDGVNLYIANRRHFQADPALVVEQGAPQTAAPLDQLLVWPVNEAPGGAPAEPTVLLEHPDLTGIAVTTDEIYVASMKAREFAVYDKATGALLTTSNVDATIGTPYQVAVSGDRYFFGMASYAGAGFYTGTPGVTSTLVRTDVSGSPMWLLASGPMLYASIGGEDGSAIWALDAESSEQRILAQTVGWAGGLALHGDALLFIDYDANRLNRVELSSQTQTTVAEISQPWGLAVEGDHAYVSTQPEFCRATPEGSVQRVSLEDGTTTQLTRAVSCPSMLLVVGDWLYWLNNGQVDDSSGLGFRSLGTGSLARLRRP